MTLGERLKLMLMRVPAGRIARCEARLAAAGCPVSSLDLTSHHLAGGDIANVTDGLIEARRLAVHLPWIRACAIDLAGKSAGADRPRLRELVRSSCEPTTMILPVEGFFEVPAPGQPSWRTRVRVQTVANLDRWVGGGDMATLESRIRAALITAFQDTRDTGSARSRFLSVDPASLAQGTRFTLTTVDLVD